MSQSFEKWYSSDTAEAVRIKDGQDDRRRGFNELDLLAEHTPLYLSTNQT